MKSLTIVYITSREQPEWDWFLFSLRPQLNKGDKIRIIFVTSQLDVMDKDERIQVMGISPSYADVLCTVARPKPTIWQGAHRLTKEDWWAASNARNTGICLCETEWISFLDDRCVLLPGWLDAIRRAMSHGYAVCGTYEKRTAMTVENGLIKNSGIIIGEDKGRDNSQAPLVKAAGEWWFGCTNALPLDWALQINGYDETCDGLSMEDVIFGLMLQNNGFPIYLDKRMKMIEDRTPEAIGKAMRREDKGISPNDKSHALLAMLRQSKRAMHQWDLRSLRDERLSGNPWPIPVGPERDWYDGQLISEF